MKNLILMERLEARESKDAPNICLNFCVILGIHFGYVFDDPNEGYSVIFEILTQ